MQRVGTFLLAGAAVLAGCTAPQGSKAQDGPSDPSAQPPALRTAPDWAGEAPGWAKLTHIERWLATEAWKYEPFWKVQGELTLAEGRSTLARSDHAAGEIDDAVLASRITAARLGFERVVADPEANRSQRTRAEKGLSALGSIAQAPNTAVASTGPVVSRRTWGAQAEIGKRLTPVGGPWRRITVHHSAEVPGTRMDGSLSDSHEAIRKMQRAHMDQREYGDIGYHFLVDAQGHVFEGRSLRWQGAHAGGTNGSNNRYNLGVCLIGDFEHSHPSPQAMRALQELLDDLRRTWSIDRGEVICHRDLKSTVCPGDAVAGWVESYRRGAPRALAQAEPVSTTPAVAKRTASAPTREASFRGAGSGTVR